jgi:hypothetical protein
VRVTSGEIAAGVRVTSGEIAAGTHLIALVDSLVVAAPRVRAKLDTPQSVATVGGGLSQRPLP